MTQTSPSFEQIEKPSLFRFAAEHFTVWKELWNAHTFLKTFQPCTNRDFNPVLVLPGFMASDRSTIYLRKFIEKLGFVPYPWDLGRNYGDVSKLKILLAKLEELYKQHQTKVSVIGWSLGGIYARELAKAKPHMVRHLITLGSPFADIEQPNNVAWLYNLINDRRKITEEDSQWIENMATPAPVLTLAIYSKKDGIVPWQICMEKEDELHQNVEVEAGHLSMGNNPKVWHIIKDRLEKVPE